MYLMIQNVGVAPVEGYTVLGVSTTRDCGKANAIGQFGSGGKHSVNLLLRNGLPPVVFCGGLRLEFYVVPEKVDDGLTVKSYGRWLPGMVGRMSMRWLGSVRSSSRARMPAGQCTIRGVAMPPSWTRDLCRRNGVLAAPAQPGPMPRYVLAEPVAAAGSCPPPRTGAARSRRRRDPGLPAAGSGRSLTPLPASCRR
jgi:hypothetical protein